MWWLNEIIVDGKKKTQLEDALVKGRSFKEEKVFEEDMTPGGGKAARRGFRITFE